MGLLGLRGHLLSQMEIGVQSLSAETHSLLSLGVQPQVAALSPVTMALVGLPEFLPWPRIGTA